MGTLLLKKNCMQVLIVKRLCCMSTPGQVKVRALCTKGYYCMHWFQR